MTWMFVQQQIQLSHIYDRITYYDYFTIYQPKIARMPTHATKGYL